MSYSPLIVLDASLQNPRSLVKNDDFTEQRHQCQNFSRH